MPSLSASDCVVFHTSIGPPLRKSKNPFRNKWSLHKNISKVSAIDWKLVVLSASCESTIFLLHACKHLWPMCGIKYLKYLSKRKGHMASWIIIRQCLHIGQGCAASWIVMRHCWHTVYILWFCHSDKKCTLISFHHLWPVVYPITLGNPGVWQHYIINTATH